MNIDASADQPPIFALLGSRLLKFWKPRQRNTEFVNDRLSRVPKRTLKKVRVQRQQFEKIFSVKEEAKHLSIGEGKGEADPSPYPLPQGEGENNSQHPKCCRHHDFAEHHQFSFGWRAKQFAPGDRSLQDELIQEMSLAVLEYDKPASFEFLFELATNRAKMYLRYEARRCKLSLEQVREPSDKAAERRASLNAFIEELEQRGVPRKWIEEVIDWRLSAA